MDSYICEACGGSFFQEWSDADALMEYQNRFSEAERAIDPEPPARVCDTCYRGLMKLIEETRH